MHNNEQVNHQAVQSRLKCAKAFVFDFLQTVVETDRDVPQMWETLNGLGYDSTPEKQASWETDAFNGCLTPSLTDKPSYENWRRLNLERFAEQSGVPVATTGTVVSTLLEIDSQFTVKPIPYANSLLNYLRKRNRKIGLCSNWDYAIQPYLEQGQLVQFDAISVSAEVGARKPHPAIFADICSKLNVNPQQTVFVGDDWSTDIVGAVRSDLMPVWIRHLKPPSRYRGLIAEFESLRDFELHLRKSI